MYESNSGSTRFVMQNSVLKLRKTPAPEPLAGLPQSPLEGRDRVAPKVVVVQPVDGVKQQSELDLFRLVRGNPHPIGASTRG